MFKDLTKKQIFLKILKAEGINIIGALFISIGIYNFASVFSFPMAGIAGISLLLHHFFNTPMGSISLVINIPIIFFTRKYLTKEFLIKSCFTLITVSLTTDFIAPLIPMFNGDKIIACIATGVLTGVGSAIIFINETSGGGIDFITMSIKKVKPYFSIGKITMVINGTIILISGIAYKDINAMIYGAIIVFITTTVIDRLIYGVNAGKLTMIITNNDLVVSEAIKKATNRSTTVMEGEGGFTSSTKKIVICASTDKEMYLIRRAVKRADPSAFIMILNSSEVVGKGFKLE